jgi:uncharacterized repeat protein (TIGR03803 family)
MFMGRPVKRKLIAPTILLCFLISSASAQTFATLHDFNKANEGVVPEAGLAQGIDGGLYGTTAGGGIYNGGTAFKLTQGALLDYSFCSQPTCADGDSPEGSLAQGTDGIFYGVTTDGGANGNYGTIFNISLNGKLTTLHSFCSLPNCADGTTPISPPTEGLDGNFYGTTYGGGFSTGNGVIYKITPKGTFSTLYKLVTLYSFCTQPNCTDGTYPAASLIQATDGNLYGTTEFDGNLNCNAPYGGCGSLFQITTAGMLTTLHEFAGPPTDGVFPFGLVQPTNGTLVGTTYGGGSFNTCDQYGGQYGCGTLFSLDMGYRPIRDICAPCWQTWPKGRHPRPGIHRNDQRIA